MAVFLSGQPHPLGQVWVDAENGVVAEVLECKALAECSAHCLAD